MQENENQASLSNQLGRSNLKLITRSIRLYETRRTVLLRAKINRSIYGSIIATGDYFENRKDEQKRINY